MEDNENETYIRAILMVVSDNLSRLLPQQLHATVIVAVTKDIKLAFSLLTKGPSRLYRKYFIPCGSRDIGRDSGHSRGFGGAAATAAMPLHATSPAGGRLQKKRPFWPFEKKIDILDRFASLRNVFYPFSTILDQIIPPFWVV